MHSPTTLAMQTTPLVTTPPLMLPPMTLSEIHTKLLEILVSVIMTPPTTLQMLLLMMQADQLASKSPTTFPMTMERQLSRSMIVSLLTRDQLLLTQNALMVSLPATLLPLLLQLGSEPVVGNNVRAKWSPVKLRLSAALELLLKFNQNVLTVTHALTML